jgi:hypothetical protein
MKRAKSNKKPIGSNTEKLKKTTSENKIKSTDPKHGKVKDEDSKLVETARKVESRAKIMGEKAADVAEKVTDQTTEIAEVVYDKVKKGVSDAYDVGSKTLHDMSKKGVKYIKKYDDTIEINKLNHDRNMKMQELGIHIFTQYKIKSQNLTELLAKSESQRILNELEILNKEIVKLGRRIKRKI